MSDVDRLVLNDADSLTAAIERVGTLDPGDARGLAMRRVITRRARELGCTHVIPTAWVRRTTSTALTQAAVTAFSSWNGSDVPDTPFQNKTELSGVPDTALRAAYMRGVREYTMTAQCSRPPLPRDMVAQARVNSLIRLAQGDPSARPDDADLLP